MTRGWRGGPRSLFVASSRHGSINVHAKGISSVGLLCSAASSDSGGGPKAPSARALRLRSPCLGRVIRLVTVACLWAASTRLGMASAALGGLRCHCVFSRKGCRCRSAEPPSHRLEWGRTCPSRGSMVWTEAPRHTGGRRDKSVCPRSRSFWPKQHLRTTLHVSHDIRRRGTCRLAAKTRTAS